MMLDILKILALLFTAIVAGVALTASLVVHPILLTLKKSSAIEIFKPFFDKTHVAVLIFAIAASVFALGVSFLTGNWWWFGLTLIMHLNGPYTIFFMMPLNRRLMDPDIDPESAATASDLKGWGGLHAVRTLVNVAIFIAMLALALGMF